MNPTVDIAGHSPQWRGLAIAGLCLAMSCAEPPLADLESFTGPTMGTTYSVKLVVNEPISVDQRSALSLRFEETLTDINQKMSTYVESSELSKLNRFGAGEPYAVSSELLEVLIASEDTFLETGGAFDPTVGPAVDLWGFGPAERTLELPSDEAVRELRNQISWSKVKLDRQSSTVLKTAAELRIDLSAIAKGYAVDRLVANLEEAGFENFLVEVGGELRAQGRRDPNTQRPWTVGIETPPTGPNQRDLHRLVNLDGKALATSGDYRNAYQIGGRRYSHTINPRTARPVTHRGASVSVFASTCAEADALATALLVMGPEAGLAWAESQNTAAIFLVYNDQGSVEELRSTAMDALLVDSAVR